MQLLNPSYDHNYMTKMIERLPALIAWASGFEEAELFGVEEETDKLWGG
jgi:hypothetical protein